MGSRSRPPACAPRQWSASHSTARCPARAFRSLRSADVLVFPTLSDGFGMVVAEAMAHGLPVITTDQAGAADLVSPDNGLIVPAADAQALAHALQWCLDNRDRLHTMRFHAFETARRRQWPHFRHDLIAALERGLRRAGYSPAFSICGDGMQRSIAPERVRVLRVAIVTPGQIGSNPRVVKEAQALQEAGYELSVIATRRSISSILETWR